MIECFWMFKEIEWKFCVVNVLLVCVGNEGIFLLVRYGFLLIEILVSKFIYLVSR